MNRVGETRRKKLMRFYFTGAALSPYRKRQVGEYMLLLNLPPIVQAEDHTPSEDFRKAF